MLYLNSWTRIFAADSSSIVKHMSGGLPKCCLAAAYTLFSSGMRQIYVILTCAFLSVATANTSGQAVVVVHDPTKDAGTTEISATDSTILNRDALPAVRKQITEETCGESFQDAGFAQGSFTRPGAKQTLVFYEYCQTGNGFGWNGLVLIENGKVVGNFVSNGGWGVSIEAVPDINRNGLTEFTLAYSGGLHQGHGGTGVELMEFSDGMPEAIGWFKASEFGPTEASTAWKLWAKPGKTPIFYKQKFFSGEGKRARAVGRRAVTKLDKAFVSKFEAVK